jgi:hypothetical protein
MPFKAVGDPASESRENPTQESVMQLGAPSSKDRMQGARPTPTVKGR